MFIRYALPYFSAGQSVLEIGPDGQPSTYRRAVRTGLIWQTADLASSANGSGRRMYGQGNQGDLTHLMPNEYEVPALDDSYDIVLSGQVIEHVAHVWTWMQELARICKPGGHVITIGPLSWPYHEAPIDCWRIYPDGMRALSEHAGLEVAESTSGCLDERKPRRAYPGADMGRTTGAKALLKGIAGAVGWPVPVAIDTVTIARKPPGG